MRVNSLALLFDLAAPSRSLSTVILYKFFVWWNHWRFIHVFCRFYFLFNIYLNNSTTSALELIKQTLVCPKKISYRNNITEHLLHRLCWMHWMFTQCQLVRRRCIRFFFCVFHSHETESGVHTTLNCIRKKKNNNSNYSIAQHHKCRQ